MRTIRRVLLASLLLFTVGALTTATTTLACPGADKASVEDGE